MLYLALVLQHFWDMDLIDDAIVLTVSPNQKDYIDDSGLNEVSLFLMQFIIKKYTESKN